MIGFKQSGRMLDFVIDADRELVIARWIGRYDFDALMKTADRLWSQPDWDAGFRGIVDLTRCDLAVPPTEIRRLYEAMKSDGRSLRRRVMLVANQPMETALAYLFEAHADGDGDVDIAVYGDLAGALRMYGVPDDLTAYEWRRIDLWEDDS